LQALALRSGRSQIALIREAIDAFLQQQQAQGRLARLRQGRRPLGGAPVPGRALPGGHRAASSHIGDHDRRSLNRRHFQMLAEVFVPYAKG